MRIIPPALLYYALVFAAAFPLGMTRELLLVPALGRPAGELVEGVLLLAVILVSARAVMGWLHVGPDRTERLLIGALALACVLATELVLAPVVRGSITAWLESFTPLTLGINLVLWGAQLGAPVMMRR